MKKYPIVMYLVLCMLLVTGCARAPRAPLSDMGQKIEIMVISDRGNPAEMTERQYKYRIESVNIWNAILLSGWEIQDMRLHSSIQKRNLRRAAVDIFLRSKS